MNHLFYDLFIFAGEASGDVHGAHLIKALLKKNPHLKILTIAGPQMRKLPVDCLMQMEEFQTMGFIDVLKNLKKFFRLFFHVRKVLLQTPIAACIFIDYPGFNLRLEKSLRKHGYKGKLIHYISPTIWAWHKSRLTTMKKTLDLVLCILPFEPSLYTQANLSSYYVGHPLIRQIPATFTKTKSNRIGIFPGSRTKEIERNFPYQLQAARRLLQTNKNLSFVISLCNESKRELLNDKMKELLSKKEAKHFTIYSSQDNYAIMPTLCCAMAVSGTITLELALMHVPTCVIYAIKPLDLLIARHILRIRLNHYCLVNILADKRVFPELYGPHLTEDALYNKIYTYLADQAISDNCINDCIAVKEKLGQKDASFEAAEYIMQNVFFTPIV